MSGATAPTGPASPGSGVGLLSGRGRLGARAFFGFKWTIYALLLVNLYVYATEGTPSELLDSLGWVMLLGVYEWETSTLHRDRSGPAERLAVGGVQAVSYAIILAAWWGYWGDEAWLDFANASLWLLVCASLAYDLYAPGEYGSREWRARAWLKGALYAALVAMAVLYGLAGEWLDTYDAALWILCFFVIELNIFRFETGPSGGAPTGAASPAGTAAPV